MRSARRATRSVRVSAARGRASQDARARPRETEWRERGWARVPRKTPPRPSRGARELQIFAARRGARVCISTASLRPASGGSVWSSATPAQTRGSRWAHLLLTPPARIPPPASRRVAPGPWASFALLPPPDRRRAAACRPSPRPRVVSARRRATAGASASRARRPPARAPPPSPRRTCTRSSASPRTRPRRSSSARTGPRRRTPTRTSTPTRTQARSPESPRRTRC